MSDDLCDESTIPEAREKARTAMNAVGFSLTQEGISDLIADLMHLADEEVEDPDGPVDPEFDRLYGPFTMGHAVASSASRNYEAELPERSNA